MALQKRFRAVLETDDESTFTYVRVPFDAQTVFGKGRPPVRVTLNGYEYHSTLAPYGGLYYLPVNQAVRAGAQVNAGDRVSVVLEADEAPRTVKPPADLARARRLAKAIEQLAGQYHTRSNQT